MRINHRKHSGLSARNVFVLMLSVAVAVLAAYWWLQCDPLSGQALPVQAQGVSDEVQALLDPSGPDFFKQMQEAGVGIDDLLAAYGEADREGLIRAYNRYIREAPDMPSYTKLFPELYTDPPKESVYLPGTVYLTFDDGPSSNTPEVLKILDNYGIKATFFVVPKADGSDAELLKMIAAAGHTIGIHSATHIYKQIYEDVDSFLADFDAAYQRVYRATGQKPEIFRFPGGSINAYNRLVYQELIAEMTRRGFTYYDWNVEGGEISHDTKANTISSTAVRGILKKARSIVLLHDGPGHQATVVALEQILSALKDKGYHFESLQNTVQPTAFSYTVAE